MTKGHTCITKLAESQATDMTIMSIAGHVSKKMLERYSHIRPTVSGVSKTLPHPSLRTVSP